PNHLTVCPPAAGKEHRLWNLSSRFRHPVRHHPSTPLVLTVDPVARPIEHHDQRRSHLFSWMKLKVSKFLAGFDVKLVAGVSREIDAPLSRPAHDDDRALVAVRD